MRNWRVITAVATVIFAALAAVLAYAYLNKADERAADKVALVDVLVAKAQIIKGTRGEEAAVGIEKVPRKNLPVDYRTSQSQLSGLVAASTIDEGQFITGSSFVQTTALGTFRDQIPKGLQAISFSVDQPHGVANFVAPGDSINLITSLTAKDFTSKNAGEGAKLTAFMIPGLKVLAVGSTTQVSTQPVQQPSGNGSTTTTAAPSQPAQNLGLITVAVTPRQAEQIAHVVNGEGQLYITLNAPGFNAKTFKFPVEIVEAQNLFDQQLSFLANFQAAVKAANP